MAMPQMPQMPMGMPQPPAMPPMPQAPQAPQVAMPQLAVGAPARGAGSSNTLLIVIFCLLAFLAGGIVVYLLARR